MHGKLLTADRYFKHHTFHFTAVTLLVVFCYVFTEANYEENLQPKANGLSLYRKLFKVKRKEHIAAVQKLILENNIEKQAKLIEIMMNTIVKTVDDAMHTLRSTVEEINEFPEDIHLKDSLAQVVENTALFADLIVRFPTIGHAFYQTRRKQWKPIFEEAIETCHKSGVYDGDHLRILHSLKQELGIGDKDPDYENPFRVKENPENELTTEERKEMYEAAKRKKKMQDRKSKRKNVKSRKHEEL